MGRGRAELVLLHGGGQNAHTWDTVALALDRPLVAVDLPGHGHSDWPADSAWLDPAAMADDVAVVVAELAPGARAVVGMSLGGATAIALATRHPQLVRRLLLVDITPGVTGDKTSDIAAFLSGPRRSPASTRSSTGPSSSTRPGPCRRCAAASCTTPSSCPTGRGPGATSWASGDGAGLCTWSGVDNLLQWDALERIAVPVLLARGEPLARGGRRRRGRIPPPPTRPTP